MFKPCVVIPVYDHELTIAEVVSAVLAERLPCILIDDGSSKTCMQTLDQLAATDAAGITLLRHSHNLGKGRAVQTGLHHALAAGYSHALQIDADGQHTLSDIPQFLHHAAQHPAALIVGYAHYDDSVPKTRLYARYLTHVWVWVNTLSFAIKDSMCGLRVYPLAAFKALAQHQRFTARMDFDTEILVRLYWEGLEIINLPTRVHYPRDGVSHFRLLRDNLLISRIHAVLFFGMLRRLPKRWSSKIK